VLYEGDGGKEWLYREDFERERPGQSFEAVAGTDESKGARALVSDSNPAEGKHCLEIHDAEGLQASWLPLLEKSLRRTVKGKLYCPLLASDAPADGRTYRSLNWGIVPQLKTFNRSPILYYVQTRDVGDGIIEVTWVVHNFSVRDDIEFNFLNVPWGGTRVSSLPHRYFSRPGGKVVDYPPPDFRGDSFRKTGGWILAAASKAADSPSVTIVYGRDRHFEEQQKMDPDDPSYCQTGESYIRGHRAYAPEGWHKRPENTWRNYDVIEAIFRASLKPGMTFFYRSYLIVGNKDKAIPLAEKMVEHVDYGRLHFDPAKTPLVPVGLYKDKFAEPGAKGKTAFELFCRPVEGSMPLFLIENRTTGRQVATTDPYIFVPQEKLDFGFPKDHPHYDYYGNAIGYSLDKNNSNWKRLLGYGYRHKPETGEYVRLSSLLDKRHFPKTTTFHLDLWVKDSQR
jgi:hypothetical protein